jgi:hypothetical protein
MPFSGLGAGTSGDPYQVATASQLNEVRDYLTAYFIQTADIDLSEYGNWTPIAPDGDGFEGEYDGDGHLITGLTMYNIARNGLFDIVSGTVKKVGLVDIDLTCDNDGGFTTGCICLYLNAGSVDQCFSTGIIRNTSTGRIELYFGGIVYFNSSGSITNCYSRVDSNYPPSALLAGGLVADNRGSIENCYWAGKLPASAGGIIGQETGSPTYSDLYWDAEYSGQSMSAQGGNIPNATSRTTAQMVYPTYSEYTDWDFDTIWRYDARDLNDGYPYLRWEEDPPELPSIINYNDETITISSIDAEHIYFTYNKFAQPDDPTGSSVEYTAPITFKYGYYKAIAKKDTWFSTIGTAYFPEPDETLTEDNMDNWNLLNIYDDLFNINKYIDIKDLFSINDEINYNPVEFSIFSQKFERNDDLEINIKLYQDIQLEYIKTYANEFEAFFTYIFERNENEEYEDDDTYATKQTKDTLYSDRQNDIIPFKIIFFQFLNIAKRFKGSLKYIEYIIDFFIRLKYGNQLYTGYNEKNDKLSDGSVMSADVRYKLFEGTYLTYTVGNIFTLANSDIITPLFTVIPQFTLKVDKLDNTLYQLNSIASLEEWETILKPIVHPLGWNVIYNDLSEEATEIDSIIQHKNFTIYCYPNRYINILYNYEDNNNIIYNLIGNIPFSDSFKTNNSGVSFGAYTITPPP